MDIFGPLKLCKADNKYILAVFDYATSATSLYRSKEDSDSLDKPFSKLVIPKEILTDQSFNFTFGCWRKSTSFFIKGISAASYHPQTD